MFGARAEIKIPTIVYPGTGSEEVADERSEDGNGRLGRRGGYRVLVSYMEKPSWCLVVKSKNLMPLFCIMAIHASGSYLAGFHVLYCQEKQEQETG